ncbi:hypothetical protein C8Q76DRAFT_41767 [Earliella scabrosa]|nr:hypothetical protein C8Q76DRAFT_41767 [Earliella scabrosa]
MSGQVIWLSAGWTPQMSGSDPARGVPEGRFCPDFDPACPPIVRGPGAPDQAQPWRGHRSCLSLAFKLRFARRERCHAARAQVASVQLWAWTSLVARSVMAAYTPACAHERGRHLQSEGT